MIICEDPSIFFMPMRHVFQERLPVHSFTEKREEEK